MTLLFEHSAEGSTDEANVAASVSGFGDPWSFVTKVGGTTIKYDSAQAMHGTRSIRVQRIVSTDTGYLTKILASAVTRLQVRAYVYMTALPAATLDLFTFRSASGFMGYINIGGVTTGRMGVRTSTGAQVNNSVATANFPLSQWVRLEAAITAGTGTSGTIEYAYYLGDSGSVVSTWGPSGTTATVGAYAGQNLGGNNPIECRFGINGATTIPDIIWFDDPAMGDGATGWLGATTVSAPIAIVDDAVVHLIDATDSTVASGTLTYSITQTSGTTTTPVLITTGVWAVTPHASSSLTYDVTATGSLGGTDTVSVGVPPLSSGSASVIRQRKAAGVFA